MSAGRPAIARASGGAPWPAQLTKVLHISDVGSAPPTSMRMPSDITSPPVTGARSTTLPPWLSTSP